MANEHREKITFLRSQGKGYAEIGRELRISKDTVKSFCRRNGLMIMGGKVKNSNERCRECGKLIVQKEKTKKRIFCSKSCREKWWTKNADKINRKAIYTFKCEECGKSFTAYGNKNRKFCSHACYINHRFGGNFNEQNAVSE